MRCIAGEAGRLELGAARGETLQRLHLDPGADRHAVGRHRSAWPWRRPWWHGLTCCCWTNPPTTWIWTPSSGWKNCSWPSKGSVVTITHDAPFLDRIATRIVEPIADSCVIQATLPQYQAQKEEQLAQRGRDQRACDKLLAQEEVWIARAWRRGARAAKAASAPGGAAPTAARREALGSVRMDVASGRQGGYQGKMVAELTGARPLATSDRVAISAPPFCVATRSGLIGPNGAAKPRCSKLILGELEPDSGDVRQGGNNLQVAYFDQMRNAIDLDATLEDFISPGSEWIEIGNQRKHVKSYLGDFLFSPARAFARALVVGRRAQPAAAGAAVRAPANVLVLDEPTNDLDIDTLELLEEAAASYDGTVFLVSHDRSFLDNVVTSTIAGRAMACGASTKAACKDWLTQSRAAASWLAAGRCASRQEYQSNEAKRITDKREQLQKKKA